MFKEIFAKNVKQIRTKCSMSQKQLVEKSSLSVRYCQHIEAGTKASSVITVFKIAKALDTDYIILLSLPFGWTGYYNPMLIAIPSMMNSIYLTE